MKSFNSINVYITVYIGIENQAKAYFYTEQSQGHSITSMLKLTKSYVSFQSSCVSMEVMNGQRTIRIAERTVNSETRKSQTMINSFHHMVYIKPHCAA